MDKKITYLYKKCLLELVYSFISKNKKKSTAHKLYAKKVILKEVKVSTKQFHSPQ